MMKCSDEIQKALIFVGDTAGQSVNMNDRSSAMLFGEAGAVMLLEKTEAQMLNSQWSNALKNESGFQNFVS